jgi:hypothetical protein
VTGLHFDVPNGDIFFDEVDLVREEWRMFSLKTIAYICKVDIFWKIVNLGTDK